MYTNARLTILSPEATLEIAPPLLFTYAHSYLTLWNREYNDTRYIKSLKNMQTTWIELGDSKPRLGLYIQLLTKIKWYLC